MAAVKPAGPEPIIAHFVFISLIGISVVVGYLKSMISFAGNFLLS